ncbi:hypothetical protein E3N88_38328 [Mikania micrantha]|uniref:Uncharacterized protein n=1 Tax=Mikania micrantha TaxID=192012 RepID=A0A5N6LTN0_9ASTR|nr:hypothetical protein E3N88_38328 [Mikania micrantha]
MWQIKTGNHFNPLWYRTKKLELKVTISAATDMKSVSRPIINFLGVQNVDNDLAEDLDVVHNNSSSNSVLCIDLSQYFQTRSTHVSNDEAASEVNPPAVVADEDEMFQGEFDYDEDDPDYNTEGSETGTEDYGGESD